MRDVRRLLGGPHGQLHQRAARLGLRDEAARRGLGRRAVRPRPGAVRGRDARPPPGRGRSRGRRERRRQRAGRLPHRRGAARRRAGIRGPGRGGFARSVGLYSAAAAVALGAGRVVYADTDEGRLAQAGELGAEPYAVPAGDDGRPAWPPRLGRFPVTVDASGDHAGLHTAIRSTAANGHCTSVAVYFEPETPLPLLEMYTRGCTFHTSRVHARALIPDVLEHVTAGRLEPQRVTSAVVGFDDAPDALADPPTKLVLVP